MLTQLEKDCLQFYREADEDTKAFLFDMLRCFAYCGEDFVNEIRQQKDSVGMRAIVNKYKPVAMLREEAAV